MMPLVWIRSQLVFDVPPVCTAYWSPEDWARIMRRVYEPLTLEAIGQTWIATGERNAAGHLLYRSANA